MPTSRTRTLLLFSAIAATTAWLPVPFDAISTKSPRVIIDASSRRRFLFQVTSILPLAIKGTPHAAAVAPASADEALIQWKAAVKTIDNLCTNWDTISKGGGDAIRAELGTANFGTSVSALFQIDKAFKILREDPNVDLIEFTELSEDFTNALTRADAMAYSSNFAGGSGKPTPPEVYLDKSKKDVAEVQRIARALSALLL